MEAIGTEFAGAALEKFGEMVVRQIANEASLVFNFRRDFEWLQKQLTHLRGFLQDANTKSTHNDSAKQWIQDVRDIAFQAEDILEKYQVESLYRPDRTLSQSRWRSSHEIVFRYKMGRKIREIKGRIRSFAKDAQQMNLLYAASSLQQQPASTSQRESWTSSLLERDSRPVAVDHKVDEIQNLLGEPKVQVIAVVGMGGLGKTFLVKHLYNKVKDTFEKSIWLSVSQTYSLSQLQHDLAFELDLKDAIVSGVSPTRMVERIHGRLLTTKSLIVLDDVWRASKEYNLIDDLGLPLGRNKDCKVVVTTRNREVCRYMKARIYHMEHLSEKDSWELFCKYAFFHRQQNTPPVYLEQIARGIAKECAKLPLAVKTVASSMAGITMSTQWEAKLRQLQKAIEGNPNDPIMQIIKLSYDWLPTPLKPCFAYFSFFPEDEEIHCEYLVHLWMAEGFILHADVGWDYLRQFANLCLVELWETDILTKGLVMRCKLHHLVLDLAVSISKENRCVFTIEEVRQSGCLRVLLGKQNLDDAIADTNFSRLPFVRTLSLFKNSILENAPAKLFSQLRVLRVLDLSGTGLSSMPESVGNLKLLRVLNLSKTKIKQVPECVAKLKSLCFFDVSDCRGLVEIPAWIGELTCLQYLNIQDGSGELASRIPPMRISKLLSLQTLRSHSLALSIEENENELLKLKDLANLTELRELHIGLKNQVEMGMLEEGILKPLVHMRILSIANHLEPLSEAKHMPFPFVGTMKVMKDLEQLFLFRFVLPSWIHGFANLNCLDLGNCDCSDYSTLSLETMPNLTKLFLHINKSCRELPKTFGKSGAFLNLRFLTIWFFDVLEDFWEELEDGVMASLEILDIHSCPKIKNVPQGLERMKSLKELRFFHSGTEEVRERLREGGEEWRKIKANNQHVIIWI